MYSSLEPRAADVQQRIDEINRIAAGIKVSEIDDMAERIRYLFWYSLREVIWFIQEWMAISESWDHTSSYPEDMHFDDMAQAVDISFSLINEPRFIEFSWDSGFNTVQVRIEDPEAIDYTIEDLKAIKAAEILKKELNDDAWVPKPEYYNGYPETDRDEIGYEYFQQAECFIDHQCVSSDQKYVGRKLGEALAALYPANHDGDRK